MDLRYQILMQEQPMIKAYILIFVLLSVGCYNQRKAQIAVAKADSSYPQVTSKFCAEKFPVIEKIVKGDSVIVTDTLWDEGVVINDTTVIKDTVRIIKTIPKVITITNTVHVTDTIYSENKAALKACEINRDNAISLAVDKTAESNLWKMKAKKRGWIMWILIAIIAGATAWKLRGIVTKK
jgi:hypothetical protein